MCLLYSHHRGAGQGNPNLRNRPLRHPVSLLLPDLEALYLEMRNWCHGCALTVVEFTPGGQ